jgi:intracellular multiplication protein IcmT
MSANEIETEYDWHWRNSMRPTRFFAMDARAASTLFLFLVHMRTWTLILCVSVMIVFWMLERKGLTFDAAMRTARCWLLGQNRPAWLWFRKRGLIDYG